ncbi:helix-turn-helix domain-containing protein [Streptomyces sp. CA-135486]|uniref:helix-turn-helix domain-containing protein n=1 Tax=Streptomyces sp. CA-135486 TaxID=3240049 RepID=UPI003D93E199
MRLRAQVVLRAARGRSNARIALETGLHLDTVRTWRGRFAEPGLPGLADRKRTGRPASLTPLQAAQVTAPACQLPAETGAPLSRWSRPELTRGAVARGIARFLSASTVRRWLTSYAIKPWQNRSSIFITDPDSAPRPSVCWTCTPAPSMASRSVQTNTSSARTGRPPSRLAAAAGPPSPPDRPVGVVLIGEDRLEAVALVIGERELSAEVRPPARLRIPKSAPESASSARSCRRPG